MKKLIFTIVLFWLFTVSNSIYSQFTPTSGPNGGSVNNLYTINGKVYAGTEHGIFVSANNGDSWQLISGIIGDTPVFSIISAGGYVFACTQSNIFRTTDDGIHWNKASSLPSGSTPKTLANDNIVVYVGTNEHSLYKSSNFGSNWTLVNNSFNGAVNTILFVNNNIYVGTNFVNISTNNGLTWIDMD